MSFFNPKEEVINIQLTQMGKLLLSKGLFNPKYYAFFDDDILYDSKYANTTESQNSTQDRILYETPNFKPQSNFSSVDQRLNELSKVTLNSGFSITNEIGISHNNMPYPIGNSSLSSEYYPSWHLSLASGEIEEIIENTTSTQNKNYPNYSFLNIPQVNLKSAYMYLEAVDRDSRDFFPNESYFIPLGEENYDIISSEENTLGIIELYENNTVDSKDNFMIEVFIEESGQWKKLKFFKQMTKIKNNILLDEDENREVAGMFPDENSVEHYFEILLDEDVNLTDDQKQKLSTLYNSPISDKFKPFGTNCRVI